MTTVNPQPLWQPDPERTARARITRFQAWAAEHHGAPAEGGYPALHRWSVDHLDTFWKAVTKWFDVRFATPCARVLGDRAMPGAQWFPGATLNYAEHALRATATRADEPALLYVDETHEPRPVTWAELRRQVGSAAICPTSPTQWSPSSPPPPWAGCGPPAPPTSAPAASWTASSRSNPSS
jgi:acetoacetyl-CoA synthetase